MNQKPFMIMKKILFLAAFLLPMMANAQLGSLVEQPLGGGWGSIVRVWQDSNKVLSYGGINVGQNDIQAFCLSDYSDFYSSTPPSPVLTMNYSNLSTAFPSSNNPNRITIRDIRIVDIYAFCCGELVDTNYPTISKGFIGWFKLGNFTTWNNVVFEYIELPFPYAWHMKKLAVYPSVQGYKAVAIGGNNNYTDYIFEVSNLITNTSPTVCFRPFHSISYWDKEAIDDILVNDDDVFVVGQLRSSSGRNLCIRKADRDNVLADPQFDTCYVYSLTTNEINAETRSTMIGDKYIATVYVHPINPTSVSTRLRIIDARTLDIERSQEISKEDKWEPEEMVYLDVQDRLVLLQEINDLYAFTLLNPSVDTTYWTDYLFHPDSVFHSLDGDHNDMFVSTGSDHWLYFQRIVMPLPSPNNCPMKKPIKVKPIDNIMKNPNYNHYYNAGPYTPPVNSIILQKNQYRSYPICSSPLNVK